MEDEKNLRESNISQPEKGHRAPHLLVQEEYEDINIDVKGFNRAFQLHVSKKTAYIVLAIQVAIVIFCVGLYIHAHYNRINLKNRLQKENELLRSRLDDMTRQLDSVDVKLKTMEEWEQKLRDDKNLKDIPSDVRKMGVGGIPVFDTTFAELDRELHLEYNVTLSLLNSVKRRTDLGLITHREAVQLSNKKTEIFAEMPSIYPAFGSFTDGYGYRRHPVFFTRDYHLGVDIANKEGTPIYATAAGKVLITTYTKRLGKQLKIEHGHGFETVYGHLSSILVLPGDSVKKGQIVALMGSSGVSTGSHLHYEVIYRGKRLDPQGFFNKTEDSVVLSCYEAEE